MTGKFLGKIEEVRYGKSEDNFGLTVLLNFDGNMVQDNILLTHYLPDEIEIDKVEDVIMESFRLQQKLRVLLKDAKCDFVDELKGKPVELIIEGNILKSWRILKEVI